MATPDTTPHAPEAMAVIGGGAMASAILSWAAAAGVLPPRVCVCDPNADRRAGFRESVETAPGAIAWLEDVEATPGSGQIMLAVKPQVFPAVAAQLAEAGSNVDGRIVISILAGTRGAMIRDALGGTPRVIRVMPNTPAQVGRGTTAVALSAGASDEDALFARRLFRGVGSVVVDLDESLMDAFTAIAGSGPAYVFYLAEAMERAAADVGLPSELIRAIVSQTIAGSAELLAESGDDPASLRACVTSKGGTTAAATGVLDEKGVEDAVVAAVRAARDRGRELGA